MKTIKPWLLIIALIPISIIGGLILVLVCAIFGTSERVPVTLLPEPTDISRRRGYSLETPENDLEKNLEK